MPRDPVCGRKVDKDTPFKQYIDGRYYYFCSEDCFDEFMENPDLYEQSELNHNTHEVQD